MPSYPPRWYHYHHTLFVTMSNSYSSILQHTKVAQFGDKEYDVSMDPFCWCLCCPFTCGVGLCTIPYRTTLHLGAEEVTKTDV